MKKLNNLAVIAGIAALFVIGFPLLFDGTLKEYEVSVVVTDDQTGIGVSADKNLNFGRIAVGSTVKKEVVVSNDDGFRAKAILRAEGNVSTSMVFISNVMINANQETRIPIEIRASVPGKFTGKLVVEIKKSKFGLTEPLVSLS